MHYYARPSIALSYWDCLAVLCFAVLNVEELSYSMHTCPVRCFTGSVFHCEAIPYATMQRYGLLAVRCRTLLCRALLWYGLLVMRCNAQVCLTMPYWALVWSGLLDLPCFARLYYALPGVAMPWVTGGGLLLLYYDWLCSGLLAMPCLALLFVALSCFAWVCFTGRSRLHYEDAIFRKCLSWTLLKLDATRQRRFQNQRQ